MNQWRWMACVSLGLWLCACSGETAPEELNLGQMGAPCFAADECGGLECVTVVPGRGSICAMACDGFGPCPEGSTCMQTFEGSFCAPDGIDTTPGNNDQDEDPLNPANNSSGGENNSDVNNSGGNNSDIGENNSDGPNNSNNTAECGPDQACPAGSFCNAGVCQSGCQDATDCAPGQVCEQGACQDPAPSCTDAQEPNDDLDSAPRLSGDSLGGLRLCDGDVDIYAFDTTVARQEVRFDVLFAHADGDLNAEILDASGEVMSASRSQNDNERIARDLGAPGRWYLRITSNGPVDGVPYELSWDLDGGNIAVPETCDPDAQEPNDSREAARTMTPSTLSLTACGGNEDWFAVQAEEGDTLRATLNFTHAQGNINLALVNGSGAVLDESATTNNREEIEWPVVATDTYYLRITTNAEVGSAYTLAVRLDGEIPPPAGCSDSFEPNQTSGGARAMEPGDYQNMSLCDLIDGEDWYAMELGIGDRITASIAFVDLIADLDMHLLAPDGTTVLDRSVTSGDAEEVEFVANVAGTHYVRVFMYSDDPEPSTYSMNLNVVRRDPTLCNDEFEVNNTRNDAAPLTPGTYTGLNVCGDLDEEDWYAIEAGAGDTLSANITFNGRTSDIDMRLLDADGVELDRSTSVSNSESVSKRVLLTGTYYLRVYTRSGDPNPYDMTVTRVENQGDAPCNDSYESNNTRADAALVDVGVLSADLCSGADSDDWYAVMVEAGETIRATADFDDDLSDIDLRLFAPNGNELDSSLSRFDSESVSIQSVVSGLFYLRVNTLSGDPNPYTLDISITPQTDCDDYLESNDTFGTAREIFAATWENLDICLGSDVQDLYEIDMEDDQSFTIDLRFSHAQGDLDLVLFNSLGDELLRSGSVDDDEVINGVVTNGGTFVIRVYRPIENPDDNPNSPRTPYTLEIIER